MNFQLIRNLRGNEVLAKTIYNDDGKVMLPSGIKLKRNIINTLKNHGFYYVYIKDNFDASLDDNLIKKTKLSAIESMPDIFNSILDGDKNKITECILNIENIVDTIINDNNININLYEIQEYDEHLYIHCVDTGIMAILIGKNLNLSPKELKSLGTGAFLHDIGKIKISSKIINKKGSLTTSEYDIVKRHPILGYNILKSAGITDNIILSCVFQHHERIDGTGYPLSLTQEKISYFAKIISICDVYTAISANRSYRPRFNPNEAYEYILSGVNSSFDSDLVNCFKKTFSIYPIGCKIKLSNGLQGEVIGQNKGFPDRPKLKITYDTINNLSVEAYELDLLEKIHLAITQIIA